MLEYKRAQEIINSPETIDVTYKGNPVWIEELFLDQQLALVSSGMFKDGQLTVPVAELDEANFHDNNPNT